MKRYWFFLILLVLSTSTLVTAQQPLAPTGASGEVVYIPFPAEITLDGDLADWDDIPFVTVTTGTMTSADAEENGSFSFAAAADAGSFYITMSSVDQTIITGEHGSDYWNEDSLEFFLNLTDERFRGSYTSGIFQININPGDIGNTDPSDITITGVNGSQSGVEAYVFATENGWGFEAAVPLGTDFQLEHGREIGFQAQANGASSQDRDVKLIWSTADVADRSWSDPSLFGSGIFYEIGQTDMPQPSERPVEEPVVIEPPAPRISLNQVGYFPDQPKYAMAVTDGSRRAIWQLKDAETGETVAGGMTTAGSYDRASGDMVQLADFSEFTTPGTYTLMIGTVQSAPFQIGMQLYSSLSRDALRYFYLNRSGIALDADHAGEWARPAGHTSDGDVTCYAGTDAGGTTWDGCDYRLNASGGWYDAGDYGKYVVNGGISVWTLLNAYERQPDYFAAQTLNIPESDNAIPDILNEARWEMEFLLGMQVPEGQPLAGMAHHKLHDMVWSGVPSMPPTEVDSDNPDTGRFLFPPSTAATLNLAATAAQCARIWRGLDADFAERCLEASETAWTAAQDNPVMLAGNTPGQGGGNYDDTNISDEQYWAAAELFITTGKDEYRDFVTGSRFFNVLPPLNGGSFSAMNWGNTAALGTISLAVVPNDLADDDVAGLRRQLTRAADSYLMTMDGEGYRVSLRRNHYVWGSNADVLNSALVMALVYDFTQDSRYLNGVTESMDYLLGRSATTTSFVSGYGDSAMLHPHHRFWGNQPDNGYPPPPPGAVAGGPNGSANDDAALAAGLMELQPARRYIDQIESYSTNEVTINWNAPLVWVASFLDAHFAPAAPDDDCERPRFI